MQRVNHPLLKPNHMSNYKTYLTQEQVDAIIQIMKVNDFDLKQYKLSECEFINLAIVNAIRTYNWNKNS